VLVAPSGKRAVSIGAQPSFLFCIVRSSFGCNGLFCVQKRGIAKFFFTGPRSSSSATGSDVFVPFPCFSRAFLVPPIIERFAEPVSVAG